MQWARVGIHEHGRGTGKYSLAAVSPFPHTATITLPRQNALDDDEVRPTPYYKDQHHRLPWISMISSDRIGELVGIHGA